MNALLRHLRQNRLADAIVFAVIVLAILTVLAALPGPEPMEVAGSPRVIDGDSIAVRGVEIRLKGIDAPELDQTCRRGGQTWSCGAEASRTLRNRLQGRAVTCSGTGRDVHGRLLATCRVEGEDVNRWLVEEGWAVSYGGYEGTERAARDAKRGLWSGTFTRPRDWREQNR